MEQRIAKAVKVTFHGIEHSQYFQGHGLAFSTFSDCATGIGNSEVEALEDALDSLAQNGWEVPEALIEEAAPTLPMLKRIEDEQYDELHEECNGHEDANPCELHYFVSVDVK